MAKQEDKVPMIGAVTFDELRTIIAAGMPIAQAKELAEAGFSAEQLLELADAAIQRNGSGGLTAEQFEKILDGQKKAANPSNTNHPGLSVFSHPDGEQKHPKKPMPFEFFYNGYPCHMFPETETWREWELMSQVQPGEYIVLCKGGEKMPVSVRAELDASLKPSKLHVEFTVTRESKNIVPPKTVLLYQLLHQDNLQLRFSEAMQEFYASMFGVGAA